MLRRFLFVFCLMISGAGAGERYDADPVRLLTAIYRTYTATTLQPGLPDVYSRRLQGLIDTDLKNTPEGDAGTIDWDVFVDGNNWEISNLKITLVSRSEGRAVVQASLDNFRKPRRLLFDLIRENGGWRIDDVSSTRQGGRWTMSKILTHAPDAFPDAKKKP
ncbi:MAG TPA: DUF3828 domain-containing protein [Patescibacteria group bacterium]|nr:DUF3828 domain-containing protein [Patescibacteria group bacterium]